MGRTINSVAIITARGGSKRMPRKNIRLFCGTPIIAFPINAALESGCFDEVMVSTDDEEIAAIARAAGAAVPFPRSPVTSHDQATTVDVLMEVLTEYTKRGRQYTFACCIYPTAALVTADRLRQGKHQLTSQSGIESVVPVLRFSYPIQRALYIENDRLQMFTPEHLNSRSQDLMPAYHDAGQWYWFRTESLLRTGRLFGDACAPVVLNELEAQDIDTEDDWQMAEIKFRLAWSQIPQSQNGPV